MPKNKKKSKRQKHLIFILFLMIAAAFFLYRELGKEEIKEKPSDVAKPKKEKILPEKIRRPKVAIVIDDLGENKKSARELLDLNVPFVCAVLPHQTYTEWIADECSRLGHEVIAHIPMEAKTPHELGKGGLYTWMTEAEIAETVNDDIKAVPHAIGISNHMGSAFTEDRRAVSVLMPLLKKRNLFFLDSLTTAGSTVNNIATAMGVKSLRRDVFLDDEDSPAYIRKQWEKLLKAAVKKGPAIALGHPKENTIQFLKDAVKKDDAEVVPLSELIK